MSALPASVAPQIQQQPGGMVYIRVSVPETNKQKCLQFQLSDTVHTAKQLVLQQLGHDLKDPWNFGLFCPPMSGKAGKFLQDERPLKDYPLAGPIGFLEFKYKRRIYRSQSISISKLKKLHSKSYLKQFVEFVRMGDTARVTKWVNKGLDPNFHCKDTGDTPLTIGVALQKPRVMIMALCAGGAHMDFRDSKESMTPLHKAAIYGNLEAITTLLDLGQSPNCTDPRGLTPLYYTMVHDTRPNCTERLLYDHSVLGIRDDQGLQEIHQACKFGKAQHLQLLISYGADINALTKNGNSPLHICGFMSQMECAKQLLCHGADRTLRNQQDQTAFQVALVANHSQMAELIRGFRDEVIQIKNAPQFNTGRRTCIPTLRNQQRWGSLSNLNQLTKQTLTSQVSMPATYGHAAGMIMSGAHAVNGSLSKSVSYLPGHDATQPRRSLVSQQTFEEYHVPTSLHPIVSQEEITHTKRTVVLQKGARGFGFVLRGAKAGDQLRVAEFKPTREIPGLQYLDDVESGSPAFRAGLRRGDYIVAIGDVDVRTSSHEICVRLIKDSCETLAMEVLTINRHQMPQPPPPPPPVHLITIDRAERRDEPAVQSVRQAAPAVVLGKAKVSSFTSAQHPQRAIIKLPASPPPQPIVLPAVPQPPPPPPAQNANSEPAPASDATDIYSQSADFMPDRPGTTMLVSRSETAVWLPPNFSGDVSVLGVPVDIDHIDHVQREPAADYLDGEDTAAPVQAPPPPAPKPVAEAPLPAPSSSIIPTIPPAIAFASSADAHAVKEPDRMSPVATSVAVIVKPAVSPPQQFSSPTTSLQEQQKPLPSENAPPVAKASPSSPEQSGHTAAAPPPQPSPPPPSQSHSPQTGLPAPAPRPQPDLSIPLPLSQAAPPPPPAPLPPPPPPQTPSLIIPARKVVGASPAGQGAPQASDHDRQLKALILRRRELLDSGLNPTNKIEAQLEKRTGGAVIRINAGSAASPAAQAPASQAQSPEAPQNPPPPPPPPESPRKPPPVLAKPTVTPPVHAKPAVPPPVLDEPTTQDSFKTRAEELRQEILKQKSRVANPESQKLQEQA